MENTNKRTEVVENAVEGQYFTAYTLLKALFWHMHNKADCKGAKFEDASTKDKKVQQEVGWKCSKCGEKWTIPLRQLRNTLKDTRLREFSGYEYMSILSDLRKILEKKD